MQGLNRILSEIRHEVFAAERRHPFFADYALELVDRQEATEELVAARQNLEGLIEARKRVNGSDVLAVQLAEAHEAYSRGDKADARRQLAQSAAVIIRAMALLPSPRHTNNPQR